MGNTIRFQNESNCEFHASKNKKDFENVPKSITLDLRAVLNQILVEQVSAVSSADKTTIAS